MEEKKEPISNANPAVEAPEEKAWVDGVSKKYGIDPNDKEAMFKAAREGYDKEHELNKKNAFANKQIYDAIQESPEVAGFIDGLTNKEKYKYGEEAFAEFGEDLVDLLTGKIDNEKYRAAKDKRKAEYDASESEKKAQEAAVGNAFVSACEEAGVNPDETFAKLKERFGDGGDNIYITKPFYSALIKMLTYDDDIAAAEVRGRGAASGAAKDRRGVVSDGVPRGTSAGGGYAEAQDPNSFNAYIRQKARMNR